VEVEHEYVHLLRPLLGQAAGYARALLRDRHDAEDAVQQAALRGFEGFGGFDSARPFRGWWFAILRNCCVDLLRRSKAGRTERLDNVDPPRAPVSDRSDWEQLDAALARLSLQHREILRLRYFGELSYRELAEALKIPEGTVMSRLHLARKALTEQFHKDES
jgi:RNA polymerase sigma-70 factor (ECF subfamily)